MFIAANWKMNLSKKSISYFIESLQSVEFSKTVNACIFPPSTYIDFLLNSIGKLPISVGGQNCHYELSGAFTGEISPLFLKDIGCTYVILGHSERRCFNNETNEDIKLKIQSAIKADLNPILCVGEKLIDREQGNANKFIKNQIIGCLPENLDKTFIAYEPIWSIGTGKIPNYSQISEMHKHIKEIVFDITRKNIKVLYGGSVNKKNISNILKIKDVDGVLVGGASLNVKDFLAIYSAAVKHLCENNNIEN